MRCLLPAVILSAVLLMLSRPAVAAFEAESPDGTPITEENYPRQMALRPLVNPKGLLTADLTYVQALRANHSEPFLLNVAAGLGHGLELSVGAEFWHHYGGSVTLSEQLVRFLSVSLEGGYTEWDTPVYATGLPCAESSNGCVQQPLGNLSTSQLYGILGLSFKFLSPHFPLAFRGDARLYLQQRNDSYSGVFAQYIGGGASSLAQGRTRLWLEFSPLQFLTIAAGADSYVWAVNTSGADFTVEPFASINATLPWVDVGVGVEQYDYLRPSSNALTEIWVYVAPRSWR